MVVNLCEQENSLGKNYNVFNRTKSLKVETMGKFLEKFGFPMKMMEYSEWKQALIDAGEVNVLHILKSYFVGGFPALPEFPHQNTNQYFSSRNLPLPEITEQVYRKYIDYLIVRKLV
jgi:hypothetical protein